MARYMTRPREVAAYRWDGTPESTDQIRAAVTKWRPGARVVERPGELGNEIEPGVFNVARGGLDVLLPDPTGIRLDWAATVFCAGDWLIINFGRNTVASCTDSRFRADFMPLDEGLRLMSDAFSSHGTSAERRAQ